MVVVLAQQAVGREPEVVEGGADAWKVILGFRCQGERAVLANEQANAELFLQPFDLVADSGLRDVQLGCRLGKAQMPGCGLERPQSIQRRQPCGHPPIPKCMSLYHPKRYKVSFVNSRISADIPPNRLLQELIMSTFTHESMINHHEPGFLSQVAETLHVWRQRYRSRRELATWSDRELHDVGISWSDVAYEAEKPFWRA